MRRRTVFLPLIFFTLLFSNHVFSAVNPVHPVKAGKLNSNSILLLTAAQNGDTESVWRLVAEKVDIEVRDDYGRTALHVAAENGQLEIAAMLIESGADIEARTYVALRLYFSWAPLMVAANWGQKSIAELLISAGADMNANDAGYTDTSQALLIAAWQGHTGVLELLIVKGADINSTSPNRLITPLHWAARRGTTPRLGY
jgi:ankyrin repeat protein